MSPGGSPLTHFPAIGKVGIHPIGNRRFPLQIRRLRPNKPMKNNGAPRASGQPNEEFAKNA